MIQLKATCLHCEGTGIIHNTTGLGGRKICQECNGEGVRILDDRNWDISIERVPPFSVEEMGKRGDEKW